MLTPRNFASTATAAFERVEVSVAVPHARGRVQNGDAAGGTVDQLPWQRRIKHCVSKRSRSGGQRGHVGDSVVENLN